MILLTREDKNSEKLFQLKGEPGFSGFHSVLPHVLLELSIPGFLINQIIEQKDRSATYIGMHEKAIEIV